MGTHILAQDGSTATALWRRREATGALPDRTDRGSGPVRDPSDRECRPTVTFGESAARERPLRLSAVLRIAACGIRLPLIAYVRIITGITLMSGRPLIAMSGRISPAFIPPASAPERNDDPV